LNISRHRNHTSIGLRNVKLRQLCNHIKILLNNKHRKISKSVIYNKKSLAQYKNATQKRLK
jgi:hypothetical protein